MSGDLAAFLRARLDEDAQLARKAAWYPGRGGNTKPAEWSHYLEGGDSGWAVESADGKIGFIVSDGNESHAAHIARHDPARVLAEVQAKRHIIDQHGEKDGNCDECGSGTEDSGPGWPGDFYPVPWPCPTLRLLALPYDTHEAYDESWRP